MEPPSESGPPAAQSVSPFDAWYATPPVLYYDRSPFQVALLSFATLGSYGTYWTIRVRRLADVRLGKERRPYWYYWGLLVPILNLYLIFSAVSRAEGRVEATGVRVTIPYWLSMLGLGFIDLLWRLPGSYATISLVSSGFFVAMHASWARAERVDDPARVYPPFMWFEWVIVVLGGILNALVFIGSFVDVSPPERNVVIGVMAVIAATLAVSWTAGKKIAAGAARGGSS